MLSFWHPGIRFHICDDTEDSSYLYSRRVTDEPTSILRHPDYLQCWVDERQGFDSFESNLSKQAPALSVDTILHMKQLCCPILALCGRRCFYALELAVHVESTL